MSIGDRFRLALVSVAALAAWACNGGDHHAADGDLSDASVSDADGPGRDGDSPEDLPPTPVAPAPPMLPVFEPCPEGWRAVAITDDENAPTICDPWPEGGRSECAPDEAWFPGDPGCGLIGSACSEGPFTEGLAEDGSVLFVLAGGEPGGLGTRDSPFSSIAEALDEASNGTTVALSKGTFEEAIRVRSGVTLLGACVSETQVTIMDPSTDGMGTISVFGSDVTIRNLQVSSERSAIVAYGARYSAHLEDLLLIDSRYIALFLGRGSRTTGHNVVIRDTSVRAEDGALGRAVSVQEGATAELSRLIAVRSAEHGVYVAGEGATLELTDSMIGETGSSEARPSGGHGLSVSGAGHAILRRGVLEANGETAVYASNEGSFLSLEDVLMSDNRGNPVTGDLGLGLLVEDGAEASAVRVASLRNRSAGVVVSGTGSFLLATDLVVAQTGAPLHGETFGRGLEAQFGGHAEIRRGFFLENQDSGVIASNPWTVLDLQDVTVQDTLARLGDETGGYGLVAHDSAEVRIERVSFSGNLGAGIFVEALAETFELEDVVVRNTLGRASTGLEGYGIVVRMGTVAQGQRILVEGNQSMGVLASGLGTSFHLGDCVVRGTLPRGCAEDTCVGRGLGDGVISMGGSTVDLERFELSGNTRAGLLIARGGYDDGEGGALAYDHDGVASLTDGLVSGNIIGVSVQTDGVDLSALSRQVRFMDNGIDLDTSELPLPTAHGASLDW